MRKSLFFYGLLGLVFNIQLSYGQSINTRPSAMGNKPLMHHKSGKNTPYKKTSKDAYVSGEILVKFKQDVQVPDASDNESLRSASVTPLDIAFQELGVKNIKPLSTATPKAESRSNFTVISNTYKITVDTTLMSTENAIKYMKKLDEVLIAEPNYIRKAYAPVTGVSNPLFTQQWAIQATRIEELWKIPTITDKRPVIAIIDTGLDTDHEEFSGNLWINEAEANGQPGIDDDGNGYIDDVNGMDIFSLSNVLTDLVGHGTHCAGIASAKDNNKGIVGMNPDAIIMPVIVLDSYGHGESETVIEGLNYAIANGADVISLSLGGYEFSEIELEAFREASKHAIIVAAAGNDCMDINEGYASFPGAYPSVLGVMSTDSVNNISYFSNRDDDGPLSSNRSYGLEAFSYELCAPGSGIVSTTPSGYNVFSGTSMATPCVAGIISRLLQCKKYDDHQTLKLDLINACKSGCIDAMKAYEGHKKGDFSAFLSTIQYTNEDGEDLKDGIIPGSTVYAYPVIINLGDPIDNIKIKFSDPDSLSIINGELTIDHIGTNDTIKVGPVKLEIYDEIVYTSDNDDSFEDFLFFEPYVSFNVTTTIGEETKVLRRKLFLNEDYNSGLEEHEGITKENHTTILSGLVLVEESLFIPEGDTLIIKSGSTVDLGQDVDLICEGKLICEYDTSYGNHLYNRRTTIYGMNVGNISFRDTMKHIIFKDLVFKNDGFLNGNFKSCEFSQDYDWVDNSADNGIFAQNCSFDYCKVSCTAKHLFKNCKFTNSTLTNLTQTDMDDDAIQFLPSLSCMEACNCYNNKLGDVDFSVGFYSDTFAVEKTNNPSYLGSANDDIVKGSIIDSKHPEITVGKGIVDISNKLDNYSMSAPPILSHLYLNGKEIDIDAEYIKDSLSKRSNIRLVFSSAINKKSLNIMNAYNIVWESDTVVNAEIYLPYFRTIYIDYLDKTNTFTTELWFGLTNMIDDDDDILKIECLEGSKIKLSWDPIEDTQSYNMINVYGKYRFSFESNDVLLKQIPIDETEITLKTKHEYDAYYIKLTNDEEELEDIYEIVFEECPWMADGEPEFEFECETPPTDLKTALQIINQLNEVGPLEFEFEEPCYDFTSDGEINILDFINVYNTYRDDLDPEVAFGNAEYTIEDSVLYVITDFPISAIEIYFEAAGKSIFEPQSGLDNMEHFIHQNNNGDYQLLAYSFNGGKVPVGKQPLLKFNGDAILKNGLLCDKNGNAITLTECKITIHTDEPIDKSTTNLHYYNFVGKEISPDVIGRYPDIYIQTVERDGRLEESTKFKIIKR